MKITRLKTIDKSLKLFHSSLIIISCKFSIIHAFTANLAVNIKEMVAFTKISIFPYI